MNIEWTQVITVSAISGMLGSVLLKVIEKYIDNIFYKRNKRAESKSELADRIIKVCSRGRSNNWRVPSEKEEIDYLTLQLMDINSELSQQLHDYSVLWEEHYELEKPEPATRWLTGGKDPLESVLDRYGITRTKRAGEIRKEIFKLDEAIIRAASKLKK